MIDLSITDKLDGFNKIGQLRDSIGAVYSDDGTETKLISVSKSGNECTIEIDGELYVEPSWATWNKIFI